MNIGYLKYQGEYIIEIEVIDKIPEDEYDCEIINRETATYYAKKIKILSITNWISNKQFQKINKYEINKVISLEELEGLVDFDYKLSKDLAICHYIEKSDQYIYLKDKIGVHINYNDTGNQSEIFFHNNGIIEGEFIKYYEDGTLMEKSFYVNGERHGKCVFYEYECDSESEYDCESEQKIEIRYFENGVMINESV